MKITNQNFQLGFYYRNRSGYQGSTFLIDEMGETVSAKSNRFDVLKKHAKLFPIVLFGHHGLESFEAELNEGIWTIQHHHIGPYDHRKKKSILKWYAENRINVFSALYSVTGEYVEVKVKPNQYQYK